MERYFEKLPNVYYNNLLVKDISRRAVLVENEKNSPYNFYPYDIKHQLRSDHIAEYYYNDSRLDWFIYMSNGIIDPYYGWYLTDYQFETLINQKYGSIENAMKKIIFYRNNWEADSNQISPSHYSSVIPYSWRKYYKPIWGVGNSIMAYSRKEEDNVTNINRILEYTISANNNANSLAIGEMVDIKIEGMDATTGTGEVVVANSTILRIQNVSGNTTANSTYSREIIGETSSANVTVDGVSILHENFSEDEGVFWDAVSYYTYETDINESKKTIRLVDNGVHQLLLNDFSRKILDGVDDTTNLSNGS